MDFPFVELVLSTFLGFGSALLVEAIVDKHKDKALRKQLLLDLQKELLSLRSSASMLESDKVYIRPYSIPIWSGARECGSLLCMDKALFFPELLDVFSHIEEANLIEMKCFELCIEQLPSKTQSLITTTLEGNRKLIKEQIELGLRVIEGEIK